MDKTQASTVVQVNMGKEMILVAIGCGRLPGIFEIAARHPFVVFGTMDGNALASGVMVSSLPVFFYETG